MLNTDQLKKIRKEFGLQVKKIRKDQGYSQESFADECQLHRTYIGAIERGEKNISIDNIAKIAATLKISLHELFDYKWIQRTLINIHNYSPC